MNLIRKYWLSSVKLQVVRLVELVH